MAQPEAPILGANGKLYYNAGDHDIPTYVEMPGVRDVEFPLDFTDVDVSARLGGGFKMHEPALGDITGSLAMLYNPADAVMALLISRAWNRVATELLAIDQDEVLGGYQGILANFKTFKASRKEAVDGIMEQMFDLKLCYSSFPPAYVMVA